MTKEVAETEVTLLEIPKSIEIVQDAPEAIQIVQDAQSVMESVSEEVLSPEELEDFAEQEREKALKRNSRRAALAGIIIAGPEETGSDKIHFIYSTEKEKVEIGVIAKSEVRIIGYADMEELHDKDCGILEALEEEAEEAAEPEETAEEALVENAVPRERTEYTWKDDNLTVTAVLTDPEAVPDDAELVVTPITKETEGYNYRAYMDALSDEITSAGEKNTVLYDVAFLADEKDENGEKTGRTVELQPENDKVKVTFRFNSAKLTEEIGARDADKLRVVHLPLAEAAKDSADTTRDAVDITSGDISPESLEAFTAVGTKSGRVEFETESFSVFALVYTVDFHWEVDGKTYEFSIPGGGYVSLAHLVEMLGMAESDTDSKHGEEISDAAKQFVDEVESVEFSSPELVWIGQVEEETSVGALKESNELKVEYSADLTEEQIAEINAQTVEAGDWALISMQPFTSEETLTVTMKDSEVFTVCITDAQIRKTVISASGDTYEITVTYDDTAKIPENAELTVSEILPEDEAYETYLQEVLAAAGAETNSEYARFFDITICCAGVPVEPAASVSVSLKLADAPAGLEKELQVVHFEEDGPQVMNSDNSVEEETGMTEMQFATESFSVYGVIVEPAPTGVNDLGGRAVKIHHGGRYLLDTTVTVNGNDRISKGSSENAAVYTFEETGTQGVYYISTGEGTGKRYINFERINDNTAQVRLGTTPQPLSVNRFANGSYGISYTVNNRSYYLNEFDGAGGQGFAGWWYGDTDNSYMSLDMQTPVLENNNEYMVLVKQTSADGEDDWYVVLNDGTLASAEYDETTGKVKVDNPMMWYYTGDHIYHHTKEVGFKGNNLPSDYYYRYIDPSSASGLNEDNESNTERGWGDGPYVTRRSLWNGTALTYTDHKLKSAASGLYIGVNNDIIVGRAAENSAAEIYLAKVTDVPVSANMNHTVNHIDISIEGGATMDVPLAYGDYYYTDHNGNRQTLTVNKDNNVTLALEIANVPIEPDDMKNSLITAYSEQHGVLNDAFYITGYSGNRENTVSTQQVRIEGSFKVSDLPPYTNTDEDHLTSQQLQARLDNRIYYTVTVTKDLVFPWEYEYEDDQGNKHKVQLYDLNNQPLSSTSTVNLSKSFNYWDPENECPPIKEIDYPRNIAPWQNGHIIYDTSGETGSGMDFKLETHGQGTNNNLAIEITKTLLTDTGEVLHPKSPVTNQFIVYQKGNATQQDYNSVIDVGVGENTSVPEELYSGYTGIHADTVTVGTSGEGIVYDYDVNNGMTYIREDVNSIHQEIVDSEGKRWRYVRTCVETEYAWREDGDEEKIHRADGVAGIPEVLGGPYGTYYNDEGQLENLKNGFLPFFVYNIYERADDRVTLPVTKTWDDFAEDDYSWEAVFKLQYMERTVTENTAPAPVTSWTDYEYIPEGETEPQTLTVTLTKPSGVNQWTVSGSFGDLPKHRTDANGNVYERQYSAEEVSFTVWKLVNESDQMLFSYDGTKYTFGTVAEESIYKPFYDHDANENWDGDWHLRISNAVGQKIEPRYIDIGLEKTWSPQAPENAAAKFILKRYKQTEYVDYQEVEDNADILVQLQDTEGNVLSHVFTKSGLPMYIDAVFAPGKTGTLTFGYGGHNYTVSNTTASGTSQRVRSEPITVTGNGGDVVIVRMTGGDLENLAEGTGYNLRITDRHPEDDLALDSNFSREVLFPLEGKTGDEAWRYTFEELAVEEGEWNPAGNYANMTIYSYYLEEDPTGTTSGYIPEIRDSAGNVISESSRIYNSDSVIANNLETIDVTATKTWHDLPDHAGNTHPTVYFKLYYRTDNGDVAVDGAMLKALQDGVTSVSWNALLKYDSNGNEYSYLVKEYIADPEGEYEEEGVHYTAAAPEGYIKHETGLHVYNDESEEYNPVTSYVGTKIWADAENNGAVRPGSLHITLKADGTTVNPQPEPAWVRENNEWTFTYSGLPVFAADGHAIAYSVVEDEVPGYTAGSSPTVTEYQVLSAQSEPTVNALQNIFINGTINGTITLERETDIAYMIFDGVTEGTIVWTQRKLSPDEETYFKNHFRSHMDINRVQFETGLPYSRNMWASDWAIYSGSASISMHGKTVTYRVSNYARLFSFDVVYGSLRYEYNPGRTDLTNTLKTEGYDVLKTWGENVTPPKGAEVEITLRGTVPGETTELDAETGAAEIEPGSLGITKTTVILNGGKEGGDDTEESPWTYSWQNLPQYDRDGRRVTYYAVETGYKIDGKAVDLSMFEPETGSDETYELIVTNRIPLFHFDILKVNAESNAPIPGARFTIQPILPENSSEEIVYEDGTTPLPSNPEETGNDGKVTFTDILPGYYEVKEAVTPAGYIITGEDAFYIKAEASGIKLLQKEIINGKLSFREAAGVRVGNVTYEVNDGTVTFTVENTPGPALPATGGPGNALFTLFGVMLTGIGGAGLMMRRRRKDAV